MVKKTALFISAVLFLALLLLGFSYISPGTVKVVDDFRLVIQGPVVERVGDIKVGEAYYRDGKEVEGPGDISFTELEPYLKKLQPGHLFFTNSRRYVSSEFIPGTWKHSVIYLGSRRQVDQFFGAHSQTARFLRKYYKKPGHKYLILDSHGGGVEIRDIRGLSCLDRVSVLSGLIAFEVKLDTEKRERFFQYAFSQLGNPYDFDFRTDDTSRIYCSQLLMNALARGGIHINVVSRSFGRNLTSPDDLVNYFLDNGTPDNRFSLALLLSKSEGKMINSATAK